MSTALQERPASIQVGRLVKKSRPRRLALAEPPRRRPAAPKSEEVRLLLYLCVGGAGCLAAFALAALLLFPGEVAEAMAAAPGPFAVAAMTAQTPEVEAEAELLPEPTAFVEELPAPALALASASSANENRAVPGRPDGSGESSHKKETPPAVGALPSFNLPSFKQGPSMFDEKPKAGCEKFGTRIVFVQNPADAFKVAKVENKQVFFIHLSGNFEDKGFT